MSDEPAGQRPPNIVFICADQLAAASLQAYGCPVPSSPNLARLADRGMRFDRCYATIPVCAPNRACMLTGRSGPAHGMISNNYALAGDSPTYAHVLQRLGYRTGAYGKFHQSPMNMRPIARVPHLGFHESVLHEDPKWGDWLDWVATTAPEHLDTALSMAWGTARHGAIPDALMARFKAARGRHFDRLRAAGTWPGMYVSQLPAELHDSTWLTSLAIDFVDRHRREHPEQPFFCHLSYVDPHSPYDPPAAYADRFPPETMPEPLPAEWKTQGPATLDHCLDEGAGFRKICDDPAQVQRMRSLYHGSLCYLDEQIGRLIQHLDDTGLWDDTIVLFTSDHGEMIGEHGLVTKGRKHWDHGIRCPFIVAGGGVGQGTNDDLTCTLDLFPTFCDWAGAEPEDVPPIEGRSVAPICQGQPQPEPWPELYVAFGDTVSVITDDRWRLTRFTKDDDGQLFDLSADPDEQQNLYHDPDHLPDRARLLERLVRVIRHHGEIEQYRNLPLQDGRQIDTGRPNAGRPARRPYVLPRPPYLGGADQAWDPEPLAAALSRIPIGDGPD